MPDTPLQAARYVSLANAFLRNSDQARLATCDARGGSLGPWHEARAHIITDEQQMQRALAALRAKYGWQMWLADVGARLSGRFARRAYLQVTLAP